MLPWWVSAIVAFAGLVLTTLTYMQKKQAERARDELTKSSEFDKQFHAYLALALSEKKIERNIGIQGLLQLAIGPLSTPDRKVYAQKVAANITFAPIGGELLKITDQSLATLARLDAHYDAPLKADSPMGQEFADFWAPRRDRHHAESQELRASVQELRALAKQMENGHL